MRTLIGILLLALRAAAWPVAGPTAEGNQLAERYTWWENVTVSNLTYDCVRPTQVAMFNCSLSFNFTNPNAAGSDAVHSALCIKSWPWDGVTMTDGPNNQLDIGKYTSCWQQEYRIYQFKFKEFESPRNFSLTLNSRYIDSSGQHPGETLQDIFSDTQLLLEPCTNTTAVHKLWVAPGVVSSMVDGAAG